MKKYNKKILILSSMLLLIGAGFLFFWTEKTSKTNEPDIVNKVLKEESYLLYVKINPVVKLSIDISYYLCDKELCSDYSVIVSKIDLLNEDAQKIYKDLDVIKKDLNKVMKELVTIYLDTNEKNEKVVLEVFTDWQKYDEYEFDLDKDKTNLEVRYEKDINVEELLQEAKKEYTITFDSNGGSKVENQIILENEKVIKPQDPNRKNYTFVEWLYNDKSYDFSIEVTKNMTLKAKWRKNKNPAHRNGQGTKLFADFCKHALFLGAVIFIFGSVLLNARKILVGHIFVHQLVAAHFIIIILRIFPGGLGFVGIYLLH